MGDGYEHMIHSRTYRSADEIPDETPQASSAPPAAPEPTAKIRVYKVTRPDEGFGGNWCVYRDWDSVRDAEFDCADPGDKITIELAEMTKEELDGLPEFEGW